jgi:hypothetical protein
VGGTGITTSASGSTVTFTSTAGGLSWAEVTGATQALSVANGYVGNRATSITFTLPATAAIGDVIRITNIGVGLPIIAQNASQLINVVASSTTTGVGGSLTGINQFCSIELVCTVANTTFNAVSITGNWTIV